MPEIISRKEARARGLKRYFTGDPCKRGHVCERYVSVCGCTQCQIEKRRAAGSRPRAQWLASFGDHAENKRRRSLRYKENYPERIAANMVRQNERLRKARAALRAVEELGIKI